MFTTPARPWAALVALAGAVLVIGLDLTVLNVALPTVGGALGASASDLQWIVDAYALAFAGAMLPAGWLGDRFGRRPVILVGLAAFAATSLLAAAADGVRGLVLARAGMGVAAALVLPLAMAVVPALFGPERRQRAVTVMVACVGLGLPLGPIVGGVLLDHFWWGSVFLVTLPVVIVAFLGVVVLLPRAESRRREPLDVVGLVAAVLATTAVVAALVEAPDAGWLAPRTLGGLAAAGVALGVVVRRQRRQAFPVVPRVLLARPVFWRGTLLVCVPTAVMTALLFLVPMHLQLVRGEGTSTVGAQLMPFMAALILAGLVAERLGGRVGLPVTATVGLLLLAAGVLVLALLDPHATYPWLAAGLALTGFGVGAVLAPTMNAVLGALSPAVEGIGSAVNNTARQTAGALGVAVLGSLHTAVYRSTLEPAAAVSALPPAARDAVTGSFPGAHVVAAALPDTLRAPVLAAADAAFTDGLRTTLHVMAVALVVTACLTPRLLRVPSEVAVDGPSGDGGGSGRDAAGRTGHDHGEDHGDDHAFGDRAGARVAGGRGGAARAQEAAHP